MFRPALNKFMPFVTKRFTTHCESNLEEQSVTPQQSEPKVESKIKTPMQFENLKNALNQGYVNNYDGFRCIVQKQVNLNTVVSHFFWLGSTATQQPIYQYRLILPYDDKTVNVSTDTDFNTEGEFKYNINENVTLKANYTYGDQQKNASVDLELTDEASATQFQLDHDKNFSMSYMQSVTSNIVLGGMGTYSPKSKKIDLVFGGILSYGNSSLLGQYDSQQTHLLFLRKVNPNRVHLTADLVIDNQGNNTTTFGAEYMLKQSKVHVSIDSNAIIKSYVETSVNQGVTLQFGAEMMQAKGHYKFGYGLMMG